MVWWVWFVGCGVVFDTPVVACVFNGFGGVCGGWGCVVGRVRVSYSLAAAQRVVPFGGAVRWVSGGGLRTQERVCTTSL